MKIRILKTNRKCPVSVHKLYLCEPLEDWIKEDWVKFEDKTQNKSWWYRLWNK